VQWSEGHQVEDDEEDHRQTEDVIMNKGEEFTVPFSHAKLGGREVVFVA